jgi:alanine racemase
MSVQAQIFTQNILDNFDYIQKTIGASCLTPVVKADAYGLGAPKIVELLDKARKPKLYYVATLDEALDIRAVTNADIAVFGGMQSGQQAEFVAHNITPVLKSPRDIELWAQEADRLEQKLHCQIHLDTAINRTGIQAADDEHMVAALGRFDISYIISHFVSSEELGNDLNQAQRTRFLSRAQRYEQAYGRSIQKSLANSSAVFNDPSSHLDMVRAGGGLWGIEMAIGQAPEIKPVFALSAKVLQVSDIKSGETIGYNELFTADEPCKIATLAMGYADGLHWPASNQAAFYWQGQRCKIAGSVSMDLTTVILPHGLSEKDMPNSDDMMELVGAHQLIENLAGACGARAYEMQIALAGTRRAHRHYIYAE